MSFSLHLPIAQRFCDFVNASPTSYHAVETARKQLLANKFEALSEREKKWNIKPGGKYFYTRNQTTIVAFCVGSKWQPGNGFNVVGAHTDSPHLELKPVSTLESQGYLQLAVQTYGGGLWTTWFDRDLGLAGRVIVEENGSFVGKLVHIDRPLLRIPTLAIHLDRDSGNKLEFNKQTQMVPVLATNIVNQLLQKEEKKDETKKTHPIILQMLSQELGVSVEKIKDFDLSIVDTQKATLGGPYQEFLFSPRLDNLMMSFCALNSLIDTTDLSNEKNVLGCLLFDHEEVGSESAQGAGSPILSELIKRVTNNSELLEVAIRNSFLISADMAHAVHPNYSDKHESNHKPMMHKGVVIKTNTNQRYATNLETGFFVRTLCNQNNVPFQEFVVRNDVLCGSTIGPILAGNTGIRTVDIGLPQLSMHSIREQMATSDVTHGISLLKAFYSQFTELDAKVFL